MAICNLKISSPFLLERKSKSNPLLQIPPITKPITRFPLINLRAMSMEAGRQSNLDHLQKSTTRGQQQQQQKQKPRMKIFELSPLGLWERSPTARTVQQMLDTIERELEDPLIYNSLSSSRPYYNTDDDHGGRRSGRTAAETIRESEEEIKMRLDMPGMTKKDVKVFVEENMVVVRAEKVGGEAEEWPAESYGSYRRRIALPENVEVEKINAEVRDGVLYLNIPKTKQSTRVLDIDVQ